MATRNPSTTRSRAFETFPENEAVSDEEKDRDGKPFLGKGHLFQERKLFWGKLFKTGKWNISLEKNAVYWTCTLSLEKLLKAMEV